MRHTLLLVALLVLLPAAQADAAFRPLESGITTLRSDGERFAVLQRENGTLALFDDRGEVRGLARPACPDAAVVARFVSVGGGFALFDCSSGKDGSGPLPRIGEMATGQVHEGARLDSGSSLGGIGRHWMQVGSESRGVLNASSAFVNWRTGAVRGDPVENERRKIVPDLDLPGLDRRLCPGLRRPSGTDAGSFSGSSTFWQPFEYDRPYALTGGATERPRLVRCGRRGEQVLRGADPYTSRLASGRVTWHGDRRLSVLPLRRKARVRTLDLPAGTGYVVQTARRLFFFSYETKTVHVARAPR